MAEGSQVKLQVQICVFGPEGMERLLRVSHPKLEPVCWLVSWQLPDGMLPVPEELAGRSDFEVIISQDRGLSRNRNHALAHRCDAPLVLIGDDDVDYSESGLLQLIEAFETHPEADIICTRYTCRGKFVKPYGEGFYPLRKAPFGWYVTSFELAFRRAAAQGLRFHEQLGIGAPRLIAGEETVFLEAMQRRGVGGLLAPIIIGAHDNSTTGERLTTAPAFLFTHGAVLTYLHPRTWPLRLLLHGHRSPMPTFKYLRHTIAGALYALREKVFR